MSRAYYERYKAAKKIQDDLTSGLINQQQAVKLRAEIPTLKKPAGMVNDYKALPGFTNSIVTPPEIPALPKASTASNLFDKYNAVAKNQGVSIATDWKPTQADTARQAKEDAEWWRTTAKQNRRDTKAKRYAEENRNKQVDLSHLYNAGLVDSPTMNGTPLQSYLTGAGAEAMKLPNAVNKNAEKVNRKKATRVDVSALVGGAGDPSVLDRLAAYEDMAASGTFRTKDQVDRRASRSARKRARQKDSAALNDVRNIYYSYEDYFYGKMASGEQMTENDYQQMDRLTKLMTTVDPKFRGAEQALDTEAQKQAASETNPIATAAGTFTTKALEYGLVNELAGATGATEAVAGGLNRLGLTNPGVANWLAELAINQAGDLAVEDLPTLAANLSGGMSREEALRQFGKGQLTNLAFNVGSDALFRGIGALNNIRRVPTLQNTGDDAIGAVQNAARQDLPEMPRQELPVLPRQEVQQPIPEVPRIDEPEVEQIIRSLTPEDINLPSRDLTRLNELYDTFSQDRAAREELFNAIGAFDDNTTALRQAIPADVADTIDNDLRSMIKDIPNSRQEGAFWEHLFNEAGDYTRRYEGTPEVHNYATSRAAELIRQTGDVQKAIDTEDAARAAYDAVRNDFYYSDLNNALYDIEMADWIDGETKSQIISAYVGSVKQIDDARRVAAGNEDLLDQLNQLEVHLDDYMRASASGAPKEAVDQQMVLTRRAVDRVNTRLKKMGEPPIMAYRSNYDASKIRYYTNEARPGDPGELDNLLDTLESANDNRYATAQNMDIPENQIWAAERMSDGTRTVRGTVEDTPSVDRGFLTDNDIDEYLSSGTKDGIKRRMKEVHAGKAVVANDRDALKTFLFGDSEGFANTVSFGRVSSDLADKVLDASGGKIDISKNFLEIDHGHGVHAGKHLDVTQAGNLKMSEDEFVDALLRTNEAEVISAIHKKNGEKNIKLALDSDNGKIVLVELASNNTGGLKLKTMWKMDNPAFDDWYKKSNPNALSNLEDSVIPNGNKLDGVALPNNTIPRLSENVNENVVNGIRMTDANGRPRRLSAEEMAALTEPTSNRTIPALRNSEGAVLRATDAEMAALENRNALDGAVTPPGGMQPTRELEIPIGRERSYARNTRTGRVEGVADEVMADFTDNPEVYNVLRNADTTARAQSIMDHGLDRARNEFDTLLNRKDPAAIPLGHSISKELSAQGDHEAAAETLRRMSKALTEAGQFSQAAAITMMRDDPMTALQYAMKEIDALNEAGAKRFGKKWTDFELTDSEKALFDNITPGDTDAIKAAYDQIGARIGRDYPVKTLDKVLEARKVAMLFNVRTNVRNVAANVPTLGMRWMADRVEAVGQNAYRLINPDFEVTQSLTGAGREGRRVATEIFENSPIVRNLLDRSGGKYEVPQLKSNIAQNVQMFKGNNPIENALDGMTGGKYKGMLGKVNEKLFGKKDVRSGMETLRNATYRLLDLGDSPFVRENFIERLGSYAKAQGITNAADVPDEAIQMAWEEAMKATYKDNSWAVQMLTGIRNNGIGRIPLVGRPLSQAAIPFLQAPGNIAARMIDYSPIRGTKGIADIISGARAGDQGAIRRGIEEAAKGLTGTGLVILGMKLHDSGILTGSYSENKNQKQFEKQTGFREYALHVGDNYFTYNWAQPFAMPLMIGTMLADAIAKSDEYDNDMLNYFGIEGSTAGKILGGVGKGAAESVNAWLDESPLQGLMELMGNGAGVQDFAKNAWKVGVENFAQSFIPASVAAIARSIDPVQRNTYDPSNQFGTQMNTVQSKIPGLSDELPARYDTWGRESRTAETRAGAAAARFLIPGDYSYNRATQVDDEINTLFEQTGNVNVFPKMASYSVTIDGETRKLNNREISELQQRQGSVSYELAENYINSDTFKASSADDNADMLNKLYGIAKAVAENEQFDKAPSSENQKYVDEYKKNGAAGVASMITGKQMASNAGYSQQTNAGKAVVQAAQSGGTQAAEQVLTGMQKFEQSGLKAYDYTHYQEAHQKIPTLTEDAYINAYKKADRDNNQSLKQDEIISLMNSDLQNAEQWRDVFWTNPKWKKIPVLGDDGKWYKK